MQDFVKFFNLVNNKPPLMRLFSPPDLCPLKVRKEYFSLQSLEHKTKNLKYIQKDKYFSEGFEMKKDGFCVLWAYLILSVRLKAPNMAYKKIHQELNQRYEKNPMDLLKIVFTLAKNTYTGAIEIMKEIGWDDAKIKKFLQDSIIKEEWGDTGLHKEIQTAIINKYFLKKPLKDLTDNTDNTKMITTLRKIGTTNRVLQITEKKAKENMESKLYKYVENYLNPNKSRKQQPKLIQGLIEMYENESQNTGDRFGEHGQYRRRNKALKTPESEEFFATYDDATEHGPSNIKENKLIHRKFIKSRILNEIKIGTMDIDDVEELGFKKEELDDAGPAKVRKNKKL